MKRKLLPQTLENTMRYEVETVKKIKISTNIFFANLLRRLCLADQKNTKYCSIISAELINVSF